LSVSTQALPSFIKIASLGQASTQDSQPVQVSTSTFAGMVIPFQIQFKSPYPLFRPRNVQNFPFFLNRILKKFSPGNFVSAAHYFHQGF
jgi:hypothetical protein